LDGGLLTGKYRRGQAPPEGSRLAKWKERYAKFDTEQSWKIVDALVGVAEEMGKPPSQVALAWLLSKPVVSSVIFGARSLAQLDENLGAGELDLPADAIAKLDAAGDLAVGEPYDFIRDVNGSW
ncbi:MAG: aldo/keto reductase, partial [Polyangiaceae bacterium]